MAYEYFDFFFGAAACVVADGDCEGVFAGFVYREGYCDVGAERGAAFSGFFAVGKHCVCECACGCGAVEKCSRSLEADAARQRPTGEFGLKSAYSRRCTGFRSGLRNIDVDDFLSIDKVGEQSGGTG